MTLLRKAAVGVSGFVARHASAGSREWAEGLAREVEVIDGDWAALGWAAGSIWVLVDRQEEQIGSLAEVPKAAQRLVDSERGASGMWWFLMQGPIYGLILVCRSHTPLQSAGCAVLIFGSVVAWTNLLMDRLRLKEPWRDDIYDDVIGCTRFYRAELERLASRRWIPMLVICSYMFGMLMDAGGGVVFRLVFAAFLAPLGIAMLPLSRMSQRMNLRRIERLDELLAENAPEGI